MKEPVQNNDYDPSGIEDINLTAHADDLDLFSEELEDRFNADASSTLGSASTATSCFTTFSSFCSHL